MSRFLLPLWAVSLSGQLLLSQTTQAQDSVTLNYAPQLQEGSVQQDEVEVKTDQTLTLAGMPIETHADTSMTISQKILGPSSEGGWKYAGEFTLMQSEMEFPGGIKVSFNSNNPDAADADGPLAVITNALKATAGAKWSAETNDQHQVVTMEYEGDPFADLDEMFRDQSSPENVKKARATELKRYPAEPVKPGDKWTRIEESNLGGGQSLTLEKEYTYAGSEQRDGRTFDKVTSKSLTVEYAMDPSSPSPAKVTDSELEVAASEGTLWYDREAQAFVETRESVQVKGTLTLEVNGQKLPGELDLTITTSGKSKVIAP